MTDPFDVALSIAQKGGAYVSPLLLLGLVMVLRDRQRLIDTLKTKDDQIMSLAERIITVSTELKLFLFTERKGGA